MYRQSDDLIQLLALDVKQHFKLLVLRYQQPLYAFLLRQSGHPQDAEDIAQETFMQAYYALVDYPAERIQTLALQPWLYRIALNIFYKRLRAKRLQLISLEKSEEIDYTQLADEPASQPDLIAEDQETLREWAKLLLTLPFPYREAVNLYYFAGLSYREIAELLEQPMGTVKSNLHRGIGLLRKALTTTRLEGK